MATSMDNLLGLVQGLQGKKSTQTTTGNTTTTKRSDMSEVGMQRMLEKILAGPGGVKDISGAARGAGLYNSTTEAQLRNDLAARAAGELEERRAGETTSTDVNQQTVMEQPGMGLSGLLKPLALASVAKPIMGGLSGLMSGEGFMQGSGLGGLGQADEIEALQR